MCHEDDPHTTLSCNEPIESISEINRMDPERKVTLRGQIAYPRTYVLFDGETLGDLIKRAGGFRMMLI